MAYLKTISNYPPYALMKDKRGFISKLYGNGHTGVDSVGNLWDNPVASLIDGNCVASRSSTLGNIATVTNGNVQVLYYHLKQVTASGSVKAGEKVGIEGSTGTLANGKHLHTSIKINGQLVDPLPYLDGSKKLLESKGENTMVREVIRTDLNLRSGAGTSYSSYGFIPKGTLINIVETTKIANGDTWGKHTCKLNGKKITGWSNIGNTWSKVYSDTVASGDALENANARIEAAKKDLG